MKKLLLIGSLLGFWALALRADQALIDSLQQVVNQQSGEDKVNSLNALAKAQVMIELLTEADLSANDALKLAKRTNYQDGVADAYDNMGLVFQAKYDYTNAMKRFVEALKIRNQTNNTKGIASSKNNIGKIFYLQEDFKSATENLNAALDLRKKIQDNVGIAETHKNLGDVYLFRKFYGKAKEHYRQAMEVKITMNDLEGAASIASFLGKIVSDLGDSEGSLVYHHMSYRHPLPHPPHMIPHSSVLARLWMECHLGCSLI